LGAVDNLVIPIVIGDMIRVFKEDNLQDIGMEVEDMDRDIFICLDVFKSDEHLFHN
jgi:hypothetical protein